MNGPVLITRSEPGASAFAKSLHKKGVKTITQPLITIKTFSFSHPDLTSYAALVFTSQHGVKSFSDTVGVRNIPVYTVGESTAYTALNSGFDKVISAGGTLADLIKRLEDDFGELSKKRLLYIRGQDVSGSIAGIDELITYEAVANPVLDPLTRDALCAGSIAATTLFSARTAHIYRQALETYGLLEKAKRIPLLSISDSVLECVQDFIHTYSADAPTMDSMEDLVLRHMS